MLWLKPQAVREKRREGRKGGRGCGYLPRVRMRMRISVMGLGQMIMVVYVLRLGVARIRFLLTMQSYCKNLDSAISDVRQMQVMWAGGFYLERTLLHIHPIHNLKPKTTSSQQNSILQVISK